MAISEDLQSELRPGIMLVGAHYSVLWFDAAKPDGTSNKVKYDSIPL